MAKIPNFYLSILRTKCPRCRQGDMFEHPLYKVSKFNKMHKNCPNCGLDYHREPGFYFGAAYFSYGANIAIFVTITIALTVLNAEMPPVYVYIASTVSAVLLLLPVIFRCSRALMLYIGGGFTYDPDARD